MTEDPSQTRQGAKRDRPGPATRKPWSVSGFPALRLGLLLALLGLSAPAHAVIQVGFFIAPNPARSYPSVVVFFSGANDVEPNRFIVKREWDFDDDGIFEASGPVVERIFSTPGQFPITHQVTNDLGMTASLTQSLTILNTPLLVPPVADFFIPGGPHFVGDSITFFSTSYDPTGLFVGGLLVSTEWDFDDDGVFDAFANVVQHTFAQPGQFPITLRVTDDDGLTDSATRTVTVLATVPEPATLSLFAFGLMGLGLAAWRRRMAVA